METAHTRRDLIDLTLENLGILVPGQATDPENVERVDKVLDAVLANLRVLEICYVSDPGTVGSQVNGAIPAEVFLPLGDCVAWAVAGRFNLAGDQSL